MRKIVLPALAGALVLGLGGIVARQTIGYDQSTGSICVYDKATPPHCVPIGELDRTAHTFAVPWAQTETGAVSRSVESKLRDVVSIRDFGAACDGSTDDAAAVNAAVAAGVASHKPVVFPCLAKIGSPISVTGGVTLEGLGRSTGVVPATTITAFEIDTEKAVIIRDLAIEYPSQASSGTSGISITSPTSNDNVGSIISNIHMSYPYSGIMLDKSSYYGIKDNDIAGYAARGISLANTNNPDRGDGTVYGNTITALAAAGRSGIYWQSGGGVRINNNKINVAEIGINIALASGTRTTGVYITGNSIEGISTDAIRAARQAPTEAVGSDVTGSWLQALVIVGNELIGANGVNIPTDATGAWVYGLTLSGGTYQPLPSGGNALAQINSTKGFSIGNVSIVNWRGETVYPVIAGPSADRGTVGPIATVGSSGLQPSAISSTNTTTISPY